LLPYRIFPEGIRIHAEPGNIFKRMVGIKMEDKKEKLAESLEFVEGWTRDEDGNLVKIKVY
jgi:hypothetical protein